MFRRTVSPRFRRPIKDAEPLWAEYCQLRKEADEERRRSQHSPEVLEMIRADVAKWIGEEDLVPVTAWSGVTDRPWIEAKLVGLVKFLGSYSEFVSTAELAASELFVDLAFANYAHTPGQLVESSQHGSGFAFLVQMRLSADNLEYIDELVPLVPAMHYVPGPLREAMMMGVPPYVADTYQIGEATGHLVVAPVFPSLAKRSTRSDFIRSSRSHIQDSIGLARRLNAMFIGLGGMLPSLTRYGQAIDAADAVVTTGHAGTISLVAANIERSIERLGSEVVPVIGVLGLGSIGQSIAAELTYRYGGRLTILVNDRQQKACRQFLDSLPTDTRQVPRVATSTGELIQECNIVVSAVTSRIDVNDELGTEREPLAGKFFIDDSQPFSLPPSRITELGGSATWVVARTNTNISRYWYDYGTMADRNHDFFGCEAEVAVLQAEYNRYVAAGIVSDAARRLVREHSVTHAATPSDTATMARLFDEHGIGISDPQTFAAPGISESVIDLRDVGPPSSGIDLLDSPSISDLDTP